MPTPPLPVSTVYDEEAVKEIIRHAASCIATQLALDSGWKPDTGFVSGLVQAAGAINPLYHLKSLITTGHLSFETDGAQSVDVNTDRRNQLYAMMLGDFRRAYDSHFANGPDEALKYLEKLVERATYAWVAVCEQFEMARRINSDVSRMLNDALDNTYRIRTAASAAFVVVGSLPVLTATAAAGGVAAFTYTGATGVGLVAAQGTGWAVALQVAGIGGVYGFFSEIAFNKNDVKRSAAAIHISDSTMAAGTGAGGNIAQTVVEQARLRQENALVRQATLEENRLLVRNEMIRARAAAAGRPVPVRALAHEGERRVAHQVLERSRSALTQAAKVVGITTSVLFIVPGIYMMREDITDAFNGLTKDIDRTR